MTPDVTSPVAVGGGVVAVHRWFAGGEDWAYHPWFERHTAALLRSLDARLKSGERGAFEVDALGGVLVGETLPDPDCPDPKARERAPTVLRVAFVPRRLRDDERPALLVALREVSPPTRPGPDPSLLLPGGTVPPPLALPLESSRLPRRALLVAAASALLALAGAVVAWSLWPEREDGTAAVAPEQTGRGDETHFAGGDGPVTARQIDEVLGPYAAVRHPYVAFLKDRAERPLSYDDWRRESGGRAYPDRDKPLPEAVRRLVERWRDPGPFAEPARKMAELLRAWGESEPSGDLAARRPFLVIDRFFAFLTRPRFVPRPVELDHPMTAFLWRLPADPVGEGVTFETEAELSARLSELLSHLDGRRSPSRGDLPATDLLRLIEQEMSYDDWLRSQRGRTYAHADRDPGAEVTAFGRRFTRVDRRTGE
jgi:hypothetical protein